MYQSTMTLNGTPNIHATMYRIQPSTKRHSKISSVRDWKSAIREPSGCGWIFALADGWLVFCDLFAP